VPPLGYSPRKNAASSVFEMRMPVCIIHGVKPARALQNIQPNCGYAAVPVSGILEEYQC
jgi:hypothetical protein